MGFSHGPSKLLYTKFFLQQTSFEKEKRNISYFINLYFNVKKIIKEKNLKKKTVLFIFKGDKKRKNS